LSEYVRTHLSPTTFLHPTHRLLYSSTHGPLIHEKAVQKVEKHVEDAVSKGAQILVAESAPTLRALSTSPPSSRTSQRGHPRSSVKKRLFGPVAALIKFETEREVIELANDADVGLAGYIYSRDIGRIGGSPRRWRLVWSESTPESSPTRRSFRRYQGERTRA